MVSRYAVALATTFVLVSKPCSSEDHKPAIQPGFYYITYRISDAVHGKIIEVRNVRVDKKSGNRALFDVIWIGTAASASLDLIKNDDHNRVRTTGVATSKGIRFVIPQVVQKSEILVTLFNLNPRPNKGGEFAGAGERVYTGHRSKSRINSVVPWCLCRLTKNPSQSHDALW